MVPETLKQLSLKVSQYFLDFLESDFKRQQAPRRRIILQTSSGFKAGMPLAPYRALQDAVWNALAKPWDEAALSMVPRAYPKALSQTLQSILQEQVKALTRESIEPVMLAVIQKNENDPRHRS
jgi:hypothetical protein